VFLRGGVMVQSNYAREHAHTIAALASAGLLSTETHVFEDPYGRVWHLTADGVRWLSAD
jgi:hypothetical protein